MKDNNSFTAKSPFHVLAKPIGPICNLACEYCFYLDKTDSLFSKVEDFKISDETLENFIKSYIEQQPENNPEINFAWQGGEPTLMGVDFFKKVIKLQEKHNVKRKKIINSLQTNGTLIDDEWGIFLYENKFLVGISIDGPEEMHNKFRKNKNGEGSFKSVMSGLKILKKYNIEFNILTVVQSDNSKHPEKVYRFLKSTGAKYFQFIPIVEPQNNVYKKVSHRSVTPEKLGEFLNTVFDMWRKKDIGKIYIQHFDMMLGMTLGYPSSLCVHGPACGRAVALEHNGNIYSCDHFVFPENYIGNINTDNFADMLDGPKQTKFGQDKYKTLPGYCRNCKFLKFCYGGCPAHRIIETPDKETGLNYLCEGYKKFYEYTEKYFQAFARCINLNLPLSYYSQFLDKKSMKNGSKKIKKR